MWQPRPGRNPCEWSENGRLVVGLQQQAHHLADEFVRPRRQPERTKPPVLFGDVDPPYWREPVALVAHRLDDGVDLLHGHAVRGFLRGPWCHRPVVGVDATVGQQIQLRVEQLSIQFVARQAFPAALTEDTQYRVGVLHFAYLPGCRVQITCAPSPCDRRYRLPGRS